MGGLMKRRLFNVGTQTYLEEHETPDELDEAFAECGQFVSEEFVEWHYVDGSVEVYEWHTGEWRLRGTIDAEYELYQGDIE
jgi:hypothetical protein